MENAAPGSQDQETHLSPEYVRISMAAAMALGLKRGRFARGCGCGCINLLQNYSTSCLANCAYCGLARERPGAAGDKSFIRVDWPLYATRLVADRIAEKEAAGGVGRICVSQVQHPRAYGDLLTINRVVRAAAPQVPLSALVSASVLDEARLHEIRDTGVDIIGVGLDAASPRLFRLTRGRGTRGPHTWEHHWRIIRAARRIYGPLKVNCHLMVGLGETDQEMVDMLRLLKSEEIAAYLFSFNPEPGTLMQNVPRAPIPRLRRIQLVKFLIEHDDLSCEAIAFDGEGAIRSIAAPEWMLEGAIGSGSPFMTDGCPDRHGDMTCNRPYGSYRPGEAFRDYPFRPGGEELALIREQLLLGEIHRPAAEA